MAIYFWKLILRKCYYKYAQKKNTKNPCYFQKTDSTRGLDQAVLCSYHTKESVLQRGYTKQDAWELCQMRIDTDLSKYIFMPEEREVTTYINYKEVQVAE